MGRPSPSGLPVHSAVHSSSRPPVRQSPLPAQDPAPHACPRRQREKRGTARTLSQQPLLRPSRPGNAPMAVRARLSAPCPQPGNELLAVPRDPSPGRPPGAGPPPPCTAPAYCQEAHVTPRGRARRPLQGPDAPAGTLQGAGRGTRTAASRAAPRPRQLRTPAATADVSAGIFPLSKSPSPSPSPPQSGCSCQDRRLELQVRRWPAARLPPVSV